MMYPFLSLNDGTEIVHSDMDENGRMKVYIEKPDEADCFHHVVCVLPDYVWQDAYGFTAEELSYYEQIVSSTACASCSTHAS